jgi:multicomponent Na+:H+ antiporter subunit A
MVAGNFEIVAWLQNNPTIHGHSLYPAALILILLGAFTKSAQFPFHFWLPAAMEGPTPVSAFLHSVTMVKAGVYLLMRLAPVLGGTDLWFFALAGAGALTMLCGAWLSFWQNDLKKLLAYSTVNGLGTLVFCIGMQTATALLAAVVFLVSHAFYKGSLFLTVGVIDHATGTRDRRQLRGLARQLPLIAVAAFLAAGSMAGLPPFIGFIAKESLYEASWYAPAYKQMLTAAALGANTILFAAVALLVVRPFGGRAPTVEAAHHDHPPGPALWLGPLLLAMAGLAAGLLPNALLAPLLQATLAAMGAPPSSKLHLALFHGLNPMVMLSLAGILAGTGLYLAHQRLVDGTAAFRRIRHWGPTRLYELGLKGLKGLARIQTEVLQSGYLHHYIITIVLFTVGLAAVPLLRIERLPIGFASSGLHLYEIVIVVLMCAATLVAMFSSARMPAIVAMGVIGYGLALLFIDFGAPDLAMTQFIIETMTVILFVLIIYRLPRFQVLTTGPQMIRNLVVAACGGVLMALLVLAALNVQTGSRLSPYFIENSLILAHGRNIVNVIIVDFRALDTLGEITVLALAGIGVYTLMKLRPRKPMVPK